MKFNTIILILLIIFIFLSIYIYRLPGIGGPHSLNGPSLRKWYNNNGYKIDFVNSKLTRLSDNKSVDIYKMGNSLKARKICGNKDETSKLLIENGVPAPPFYVCDSKLSIKENMANIYLKLNPPFVVKPTRGTKGQGVTVDINTYSELFEKVKEGMANSSYDYYNNKYNKCLVEEYTKGRDYRIFMHKHKVIDIVEKVRGHVEGDGNSTLRELINDYNNEAKKRAKSHTLKNIDKKFFKKQGYDMDSVVEQGKKVELSGVINLSNGALSSPVELNDIAPENIEVFQKCSELIGGINLGIDYVSPSISLPYTSGGVIIEVNSQPGFGPHRIAHRGDKEQKIYKKFIDSLFI